MPELVHWNPRRRLRPQGILWRIPLIKREDNFGDLLGPWIATRICKLLNLGAEISRRQRLVTVGSNINVIARDGDIIWGSGIHGNFLPLENPLPNLDVRAVRGPLTAAVLRESQQKVPDVYGDPGLLIPYLWTDEELGVVRGTGGTIVVPNYRDLPNAPAGAISPLGPVLEKVRTIASAERVIASSLHGVVVAEAYGVPATLVASGSERRFKYEDYYRGTGRPLPPVASDWKAALHAQAAPPIKNWDSEALVQAFPRDLWT